MQRCGLGKRVDRACVRPNCAETLSCVHVGTCHRLALEPVPCSIACASYVQALQTFSCVAEVLRPGGLFVLELGHPGESQRAVQRECACALGLDCHRVGNVLLQCCSAQLWQPVALCANRIPSLFCHPDPSHLRASPVNSSCFTLMNVLVCFAGDLFDGSFIMNEAGKEVTALQDIPLFFCLRMCSSSRSSCSSSK